MPRTSDLHPDKNSAGEAESLPTSFAVQTLIAIAERRKGIDATRCRLALLHSQTAMLLHRSLRAALARHGLTGLQFAVLVILFSTEPEPLAASVLADHAAVSRASITDALDKLEAHGCVTRLRDEADRRVMYVRITAAGQDTVDTAINDYLAAAQRAARLVRPADQRNLFSAYLALLRGLTDGRDIPAADGPAE